MRLKAWLLPKKSSTSGVKKKTVQAETIYIENLSPRLNSSPFWQQVGWQIQAATDDSARVCLPYNEANTTAATALHGGVIAATLDIAGSLAAWSGINAQNMTGRTLACDVSYIAGALGEDIFGEARVLRRGKEIVYCEVKALNLQRKLLATGNHVFHIGPSEAPPSPPETPADSDPQVGNTMTGLGSFPSPNAEFIKANIAMLQKMDGHMPYMAQIGWSFKRGDFGFAEFTLPAKGTSLGEDGGLAGGALLSAVDHAGSLAAWMTTELGNRSLFGSTVNTKLQTFTPRVCRDVIVQAKAAGGHGNLINSVVNILTEYGEPVASGSTIYRIIKRDKK